MKTPRAARDAVARRTLDHELAIVYGAIDLVASGVSSRITCAGLHYAAQILPDAEAAGRERGVRVVPIWSIDEGETDLTIEVADDA
jgi:hypothetical protein